VRWRHRAADATRDDDTESLMLVWSRGRASK
jgi:hypothetical protein